MMWIFSKIRPKRYILICCTDQRRSSMLHSVNLSVSCLSCGKVAVLSLIALWWRKIERNYLQNIRLYQLSYRGKDENPSPADLHWCYPFIIVQTGTHKLNITLTEMWMALCEWWETSFILLLMSVIWGRLCGWKVVWATWCICHWK